MATQSFNKWVKATVVALALAVPSLSQAAYYNSCNPCNPCDPCPSFCDVDFTFGADFIYWKPCIDELEYTSINTSVEDGADQILISGDYVNVRPQWKPGFRLYLGVPGLCYDFDLVASYTWLYSGTNSSAVGDAVAGDPSVDAFRLHPMLDAFDETVYFAAAAGYKLHYNEWDVLFTYRISCNPCHTFIPHFGIAGIIANSTFSGVYSPTIAFEDPDTFGAWTSTANYWGVGLRVGADYEYQFSRCLKAFARGQGTLLAGEAKNTDASFAPGDTAGDIIAISLTDDHKSCHMVPGYHLAIGVQYDDRMCDMDVFFRIGYEFLNWWNMPNQRTFVVGDADGAAPGTGNGVASATSSSVRNLGFQGLFVGLGVSF